MWTLPKFLNYYQDLSTKDAALLATYVKIMHAGCNHYLYILWPKIL